MRRAEEFLAGAFESYSNARYAGESVHNESRLLGPDEPNRK